jgi:hypothetical protein
MKHKLWILAVALGAVMSLPEAAIQEKPAIAAPAQYRVGMKVRAKKNCSVQGFEVKKGVVLDVAAVRNDAKGKTEFVDLTVSGMGINNVPARVMDSLFSPA